MKKVIFVSACLGILTMLSCGGSGGNSLTIYGGHSATAASANIDSESAPQAGSPTSLKLSMYAAWACLKADCTSCTQVTDYGATPQEKNLFDVKPVLFQGNPAAGTYNCIIIKMNDTMKFIADATAAAAWPDCKAGTEYTYDIYRANESDSNTWVDMNKTIIPSTGSVTVPGTDIVYLFASTTPTSVTSVSPNQTVKLTTPLVVPGQTTIVFDFTGKVSDTQNACWLEGFPMSFE